jgi:hypothetical protein
MSMGTKPTGMANHPWMTTRIMAMPTGMLMAMATVMR